MHWFSNFYSLKKTALVKNSCLCPLLVVGMSRVLASPAKNAHVVIVPRGYTWSPGMPTDLCQPFLHGSSLLSSLWRRTRREKGRGRVYEYLVVLLYTLYSNGKKQHSWGKSIAKSNCFWFCRALGEIMIIQALSVPCVYGLVFVILIAQLSICWTLQTQLS